MRLLLSFLLFLPLGLYAQGKLTLQDKPFTINHKTDKEIWGWLEQQQGFSALNKDQKQMYYWTNLFRKNPRYFMDTVIREFLRQFPEAHTNEVKSLEADIANIKGPLPYLAPESGLLSMSSLHAQDLAKRNGVISHRSSDGKNFQKRLNESGTYRCGAENIFSGSHSPLEALILLLIDHGVPDKGHRVNLMDPLYTLMGASFSVISAETGVWVQDFGCF